jgi:uncharacterized protein YdeI (YjbR/CyaY-like superfamily)
MPKLSPDRSGSRARFTSPAAFRAWLEKHHATRTELQVHCFKKAHAHKGMTYLQAVDEALCFGWIDGITHRFDHETYLVRFTPRKPKSTWSLVNIAKVERLIKAGRMTPPGMAAFTSRSPERTGVYLFELKTPAVLAPEFEAVLKRHKRAWTWFQSRPPGYRRIATHWVMSAKQHATRQRRLQHLVERSTQHAAIAPLTKKP